MDILRQGDTERIIILALDSSSLPVTGATCTVAIRRDSNGYWWNGSGFVASYTTVSMTEVDSANLPGVYSYDFIPTSTDFACIIYGRSSTGTVVNDPWVGQLRVGSWSDELSEIATAITDSELTTIARTSSIEAAIERLGRKIATIVERMRRV